MMIIPYDKFLHFIAGAIAGVVAVVITGYGPAAPALALVAGLLKELSDWISNQKVTPPRHTVEFLDVMATVLGGIAVMLVYGIL